MAFSARSPTTTHPTECRSHAPILSTLILIALMVVAFYFLIMRPQRKRQQAIQQTMNELTPGTRVMLGSGIFGTVVVGRREAGRARDLARGSS